VHDFNGGIMPSGLFWLVELPADAFTVAGNGRLALLRARDVPVLDSFQLFSDNVVPALVSFDFRWETTGPAVDRGKGKTVPPPTGRPSWASSPRPAPPAPAPGPSWGSPSAPTPAPAATVASPSWGASTTASSFFL
jgi:hypothetical protein